MRRDLNILLVDDDDAVEVAIRYAISREQEDHDLYVAKNGSEGLELLRQVIPGEGIPEERRIILLDCHMPIMDGLQFLSELRQDPELRRIPVFMFTSSVDSCDRNSAYDLGISGFMPKPTTMEGYRDIIHRLAEFLKVVYLPA